MKNNMTIKLMLLACISIAFASCKKNEVQPLQTQNKTVSTEQQIADLIKRADKNLYAEVYGSVSERGTGSTVTYIRGYFRIPDQGGSGGNVDNGFCMNVDGVCMVVVSSGGNASGGGNLQGNTALKFAPEENARLIINTDHPVVQSITELKTVSSNGGINVSFKR